MPKDCNMIIGLYYETSSGAVARTTGWDGRSCEVLYHFDDGQGSRRASEAEVASWMPRHDLDDSPQTRNTRLTYTIVLLWDVQRRSDMVSLLKRGVVALSEVHEALPLADLRLPDAEQAERRPDT